MSHCFNLTFGTDLSENSKGEEFMVRSENVDKKSYLWRRSSPRRRLALIPSACARRFRGMAACFALLRASFYDFN
jgi:hypothetical protein